MNNLNLSSKKNSVSSYLIANKDYIANSKTKFEAVERIKEALSECKAEKANEIIRIASKKRTLYDVIQYVWDIILKGDGLGSIEDSVKGIKRDH